MCTWWFRPRSVILLYTTLSISFPSSLYAENNSPEKLILQHRCHIVIQNQLAKWETNPSWFSALGIFDAAQTYRSATREVAVWLELRIYSRGAIELLRKTPEKVEKITWGLQAQCASSFSGTEYHYDSLRMKDAFSDEYLKKLLRTHRRGVVYAWSPSMPFSVQGAQVLTLAAHKMGLKVFYAMDPHADRESARRALSSLGAGEEALRRVESIELYNRGVGVHYPAILVFRNGRITGQSLPGVKSEKAYQYLLAQQLNKK